MKYFYGQNLEFYNYYRRKATYLDHKYFVRHQYDLKAKFQTNLHNFTENIRRKLTAGLPAQLQTEPLADQPNQ